MRILTVAILTMCALAAAPQPKAPQTRVELRFVPALDDFAAAVREYEQIWAADGARMVAAMERISGLSWAKHLWCLERRRKKTRTRLPCAAEVGHARGSDTR